jgi:5-methylcytosine-specific restriction enzyme A
MPLRPQNHQPFKASAIQQHRPTEAVRLSPHRRGYTARWQRYRLFYLSTHPLCSVAGCNLCATDVDHIVPVTGPDDEGFWDESNHSAKCHACHSRKTAKEDRNKGRRQRKTLEISQGV